VSYDMFSKLFDKLVLLQRFKSIVRDAGSGNDPVSAFLFDNLREGVSFYRMEDGKIDNYSLCSSVDVSGCYLQTFFPERTSCNPLSKALWALCASENVAKVRVGIVDFLRLNLRTVTGEGLGRD